jgi:hypothetical protein
MPSVTSKKLAYIAAVQFKESFYEPAPEIGYVFMGNHIAYPNEANPSTIDDTIFDEKTAWDNMFAAKKITGNDVELVVPRVNWTTGAYYKQYDDLVPLENLATSDEQIVFSVTANSGSYGVNSFVTFSSASSNTSANARIYVHSNGAIQNVVVLSNGVYGRGDTVTATPNTGNASLTVTLNPTSVKPMYVMTSERNVYKCLSNNNSIPSTVEPRGDYTSSNGNIATSDGYIWKYMFNVKPSNRFLTDEWIPVPTSVNQLDYGSSSIDVIDGELTTIVVTNNGDGYYENNVRIIDAFTEGCTVLTLANTTNVAANMSISGTGITVGSYVQSVGVIFGQPQLTLSTPTSSSGGGNTAATAAQLRTRIFIDGDGTSTVAAATINTVGNVEKISVTTIGTGYSRANVFIFGTGSNAAARAILDMKYGHANNPARELMANSVMVCSRVGEIDTTENGKIPANTTFRQYGIFVNPHKYGDANVVTSANASGVVSQTRKLTLVPGGSYSLDEFVYQGTSATNAVSYGFVLDQTSNEIRITNSKGTFQTGVPVIGANSGVSRLMVSTQNPEFEPYSGDMLYIENDVPTRRFDGQAENIRLIVRF